MLRFFGDLFIGWVVFTPEGKKVVNKLIDTAFTTVKDNIVKSTQLQEIFSLKDIFTKDEDNDSTTKI